MKDKMAAAGLDDSLFGRQLAIIGSMTKAERANPDMLKHSARSASPPAPAPTPPTSTSF
jgi:signal recognition particle subunit SRP54